MSDLTRLSIEEVAQLVATRTVSSTELTEAVLARIAETDTAVRAFSRVLADQAQAEARQADREIGRGHWRGPLHGIPLGIKDIFYVKGAPTEAGSRVLKGFTAPYEATVVTALRESGAVIVGKTVTHEFAWGANVVPTRNPWQLDCFPGGSSAGSGVAVAVGSAFGALGSDSGGSIRIPASMNGIVGLKPTFGLVSRYGVVPLGSSLDHVGPLARTIGDCALLLQAIAGHDPQDSGSAHVEVPDYRSGLEGEVDGLVLGIDREHSMFPGVKDDVRAATEAVIDELGSAGVRVVDVRIPELDLGLLTGITILLGEASMYHRRWLREHAGDYEQGTRILLQLGELLPATHYLRAQQVRALIKQRIKQAFNAYGLDGLIAPTMPISTVPVDAMEQMDDRGESPRTLILHHSFLANVSGQPALTLPCGFDRDQLPIGIQLLGRPFGEHTLFRIARAYERGHDWHKRRPELQATPR